MPLRVLSLGFTRSLWDRAGDTYRRLAAIADSLDEYHVIVHSLVRHGLEDDLQLAKTGFAYATRGRWKWSSWLRMVSMSIRLGWRRKVHLVQAQDPLFSGTAGWVAHRVLNVPLNVCVYGSDPYDPHWTRERIGNRLFGVVARWIVSHADGIQVDSHRVADSLVQAGVDRERIVVRAMVPTHLADFRGVSGEVGLRNVLTCGGRYKWVGLFVGRIARQKDPGMLLVAARAVVDCFPDARFIVIGDGPELVNAQKHAESLGLDDNVLWAGKLPHEAVAKYMAVSDALLLSSRYEGFPRVLMEAAAVGLPIVTTNVGSAAEVVSDSSSGFLVAVGDADQFARRIVSLIRDSVLSGNFAAAAYSRVHELLANEDSADSQVRTWELMYRRTARL